MHPLWKDCLDEAFKWLGDVQQGDDLVEIVQKLLLIINNDEQIHSVYESSRWAVCMAFLDYKNNTHFLSNSDLNYARTRGGIVGLAIINGEVVSMTIRQFLEERDIGFYAFMNPYLNNYKPPAA